MREAEAAAAASTVLWYYTLSTLPHPLQAKKKKPFPTLLSKGVWKFVQIANKKEKEKKAVRVKFHKRMSKFRKRAIPPKKQKSYIGYGFGGKAPFCLQATTHLMLLKGLTWKKQKYPKKLNQVKINFPAVSFCTT
jgi:hypothetical protein